MNKSWLLRSVLAATVFLGMLLCWTPDAEARRGIAIYHSGEDIFVAGDGSLPAPFDQVPTLKGAQAGYKCSIFGLFWAYFTISDCKAVAFKDDSFWEEPALVAAIEAKHPQDTMKVGLWTKHGRIPMGLLIVILIGFAVYGQFSSDDDDDEAAQPASPPVPGVPGVPGMMPGGMPQGTAMPQAGVPQAGASQPPPAYGQPPQAAAPAPIPGQPPVAQPAYGQPQQPGVPGQAAQPAYGQPQQPGVPGQAAQPVYGQPQQPGVPGQVPPGQVPPGQVPPGQGGWGNTPGA